MGRRAALDHTGDRRAILFSSRAPNQTRISNYCLTVLLTSSLPAAAADAAADAG